MLHRRTEQQTSRGPQTGYFVLVSNALRIQCPLRNTAETESELWTFCASCRDLTLPVQLLSQLGETHRVAVQTSLDSAVSTEN